MDEKRVILAAYYAHTKDWCICIYNACVYFNKDNKRSRISPASSINYLIKLLMFSFLICHESHSNKGNGDCADNKN